MTTCGTDLSAIACPAVVLWGARDLQLPLSDGFELARRIGAPIRVVADCGHLLLVERPDAVVAALEELDQRAPLDGVLDLDVAPLDRERVGEVGGERLDAESLGRVVTCRDQVDPELPRGGEVRLLRLAREERVEALVGGPDQVVAGCTGRDREALDPFRPVREDERLPFDGRARRAPSSSPIESPSSAQRDADAAERALGIVPIRAASCAALPSVGCASSARW